MTDTNINIDIAKEIVVSFIGQHQTPRYIYMKYMRYKVVITKYC